MGKRLGKRDPAQQAFEELDRAYVDLGLRLEGLAKGASDAAEEAKAVRRAIAAQLADSRGSSE